MVMHCLHQERDGGNALLAVDNRLFMPIGCFGANGAEEVRLGIGALGYVPDIVP